LKPPITPDENQEEDINRETAELAEKKIAEHKEDKEEFKTPRTRKTLKR